MTASKQTKAQARTMEKKLAALELRKQGKSYWDIAQTLGFKGTSTAYAAVMSALKTCLREPTEEVRSLELERLDTIIDKLWPGIGTTVLGVQVTDRVIKLMERRARLLGLDMPIKIAPTDPTGEQEYDSNGVIGRLLPELTNGSQEEPVTESIED